MMLVGLCGGEAQNPWGIQGGLCRFSVVLPHFKIMAIPKRDLEVNSLNLAEAQSPRGTNRIHPAPV